MCECCHPCSHQHAAINYSQTARGFGQTSLTSQASGVQQGKRLLLQKQHRGPSKTFLDLGSSSGTFHLIAYNECLFQKDYYEFCYYFEKRGEDSYQSVNLLLI